VWKREYAAGGPVYLIERGGAPSGRVVIVVGESEEFSLGSEQ